MSCGSEAVAPKSAYMRMHEAVRTVVEAVIEAPETGEAAALEIALTAAFVAHDIAGPDHQAYRDLAIPLVEYFLSSRRDHTPEQTDEIILDIDGDTVVVRADDLLMHADGQRRFRRVRTGHKGSNEDKDIGAAALVLAANQAFPGTIVELIHLADGAESRSSCLRPCCATVGPSSRRCSAASAPATSRQSSRSGPAPDAPPSSSAARCPTDC